MEPTERGFILLLKSAITGDRYTLPEEFSLDKAAELMEKHNVQLLGFQGALNCGLDKQLPVMQKLRQLYLSGLFASEKQLREIHKICDAFEAEHIDYMPLKGSHLKYLYPQPELRTMGDADILIRLEQYDRIIPIMQHLGFTAKMETDHELVWTNPSLYLELHKRVIPSYNDDYYSYFGEGWNRAQIKSGHCYQMKPEDEYIYLFTHFAKHYRDGGIGCRHILDLWVFQRNYTDLDMDYIHQQMKKLQLEEFHTNIQNLMGTWFSDRTPDERSSFISAYILGSGVWGTFENHASASAVRQTSKGGSNETAKWRLAWKFLFPSGDLLQDRYPVLKSHPGILPFVWVWRFGDALINRPDHITFRAKSIKCMTADNVKTFEQNLEYVGLKFRLD